MAYLARDGYSVLIQQQSEREGLTTVRGVLPEELRMEASAEWDAPFSNGILGMLPGSLASVLRAAGVRPATKQMSVQIWQGTTINDMTFDMAFPVINSPYLDVRQPIIDLMKMVTPYQDGAGLLRSPGPTLDDKAVEQLVHGVVDQAASIGAVVGKLGASAVTGLLGALLGDSAKSVMTPLSTSTKDLPKEAPIDKARSGAPKSEADKFAQSWSSWMKNTISIQFGEFLILDNIVVTNVSPNFQLSMLDYASNWPNLMTVSVSVRPTFMLTADDWERVFIIPSA